MNLVVQRLIYLRKSHEYSLFTIKIECDCVCVIQYKSIYSITFSSLINMSMDLDYCPELEQARIYRLNKEHMKEFFCTGEKTKEEKNYFTYLANIDTIYDCVNEIREIIFKLDPSSHKSGPSNLDYMCNNAIQSEVNRYHVESKILHKIDDEYTNNDSMIYKSLSAYADELQSDLKALLQQYRELSLPNDVTKCDKRNRNHEMDVDINLHISKKVRV